MTVAAASEQTRARHSCGRLRSPRPGWRAHARPGPAGRHDRRGDARRPVFFHGRQVACACGDGAGPQPDAAGGRRGRRCGRRAARPTRCSSSGVSRRPGPTARSAASSGTSGGCVKTTARFTTYDFRPVLEAASGGRWPNRDEVFVLLGASLVEAPEPTAPTRARHRPVAGPLRRPRRHRHRPVPRAATCSATWRRALNRSRWDFVLQSADAAIWVSSLRPRGSGFELDPGAKVDTGRWLEVSGTVHVEGSKVWIDGESLRLATAADRVRDVVPPPRRSSRRRRRRSSSPRRWPTKSTSRPAAGSACSSRATWTAAPSAAACGCPTSPTSAGRAAARPGAGRHGHLPRRQPRRSRSSSPRRSSASRP